jgi:hypothetical protein
MKPFEFPKLWLAAIAGAALVCGSLAARGGGPAVITHNDVLDWDDFFDHGIETVTGVSKLVRTDSGIGMQLVTTGLEPGAYTIWWLMFQNPENCGFGPGLCGDDLADYLPASEGGTAGFGFTFAAGHVVAEGQHMAAFGGHLKVGTVLEEDNLDPIVFKNARKAEIHFVVRYHGPVDPERMPAQIHTGEFDLEDVIDVQFAVNPAP